MKDWVLVLNKLLKRVSTFDCIMKLCVWLEAAKCHVCGCNMTQRYADAVAVADDDEDEEDSLILPKTMTSNQTHGTICASARTRK